MLPFSFTPGFSPVENAQMDGKPFKRFSADLPVQHRAKAQ
jgi:hypothetical protein